MKKYKILGIAPYEGFKRYLMNSINNRDDVDADIYSASLETAVDLIKSLDLKDYDAVISRGRTGKMVQDSVSIPFVNVEFSGYDLMRALKLAQFNQNKKIAFLTFFDFAQSARFLTELLEFKTDIIIPDPPTSVKDMEDIVEDLYYNKGVQLFVGDGACTEYASTLGCETVLITSGAEAMDKAVDEAVNIVLYAKKAAEKNDLYRSFLYETDSLIAVFNSDKELIYSKLFADEDGPEIYKALKKHVPKVFSEGAIHSVENTGNYTWKIHGKAITKPASDPMALFQIKKSFVITDKKMAACDIIDQKVTRDAAALISTSVSLSESWEKLKSIAKNKTPILLYGNSGTGKKTLAYAIHAVSKLNKNPLISIDCCNLDSVALTKLFEDERSPLYENDYTILFKKVNQLSPDLQNKLSYYISSTALTSRNRVLSTFTGSAENMIASNLFSEELYHKLAGVHFYVPTLQERKEDIPSIARNFLTEINLQLPVQIAGFEAEAMNLIENYNWEYGIVHLHFILKQLVMKTTHQFITVSDVSYVLSQNTSIQIKEYSETPIDITKTLDEINLDIINLVLAEENGNQSKTAKRLGISRSTLWKRLS